MSGYLESVLVLLAINTVLAYGAFLPMVAGQLNLGVAAFVAIGAYSAGYLSQTYGLHPVLAAMAAIFICAFLGWLVAFPILRTRGIYLALATFALNQVVQGTILNLNVVGGASGYPVPAHIGFPVVATFAVLVVVAVVALFHTRFGISVTAVSDDERVADLMGLSVRGLKVVDQLSFAVARGERLALIGPNGAGKTTVFNLITGVYAPDSGAIVLEGNDITALPSRFRIRRGLARTFQNIRLMAHLTVLENVMIAQYARAPGIGALFQ